VLALPHLFEPRTYQGQFISAMRAGKKRAVLVWPRRHGKDVTAWNWTIECAALGGQPTAPHARVGTYFYFLPTYTQAKKIIWDGMQADGLKFLQHIPEELIAHKHETELKITLITGSVIQLVGSDNIDSIVGTNPVGCVFSEYAIGSPRGWNLVRPILAENGGWAVFIYTPRGRNHGHDLYEAAKKDPSFYVSKLTVLETERDGLKDAAQGRAGDAVVSEEDIDRERRTGMPEELIQQEFYTSFEGALVGSYYGDQVQAAHATGRVTVVAVDPLYPVDTAWDLGVDDETAIVFTQTVGNQCRFIDYLEARGHGLEWYAARLRELGYNYGRHYAPHDMKVTEWGSGNTRLQTAAKMGLHFEVVPKLRIEDGIQAVRRLLPMSVFDAERCSRLLDALSSYRRAYNEETGVFLSKPQHDWASHPADAARYRAVAWTGGLEDTMQRAAYADHKFNPVTWDPRAGGGWADIDGQDEHDDTREPTWTRMGRLHGGRPR
jgi:hypothetical protein